MKLADEIILLQLAESLSSDRVGKAIAALNKERSKTSGASKGSLQGVLGDVIVDLRDLKKKAGDKLDNKLRKKLDADILLITNLMSKLQLFIPTTLA